MAVTKITFENKTGIQNDASVARKNKVVDEDMNEIKQVVNNNADEVVEIQENIEDLQGGQGTADADITSLKNRVNTLETDNTQNKSDINILKNNNETNKSNISTLQENVSDLETNKVSKVDGMGLSEENFSTGLKNKLAGLKNYDDTELQEKVSALEGDNETNKSNIEELQEDNIQNKADITDIKEEQETQNEKINTSITKNEAQDELISKLKNALINAETEEAKSLNVEDASAIGQLEVFGNQEQETVKGIQILQNTNQGNTGYNFSTNPTGVGKVEEIDFLGTKGAKFSLTEKLTSWKYITRNTNLSKLKNNTTYTIQFDCKTNYNESALMIRIQFGDTSNTFLSFPTETVNNETKRIKLVATSNDTALNAQILYIQPNALNDVGEEFSITNLILVEGDYSNTELEWEDYTDLEGSPSPNHPSEVACLGSNKNEFNGSNAYNGYVAGEVGQKISYQSSTLSKTYKSCCKLIKNKNYTLSFNKNNPANTNVKVCAIADEDENVLQVFNLNPAEETMIITPTNTGYLYLVMDINATNIKLEEGTEATSYSPNRTR